MTIICPGCNEEICDEFDHCPDCRFDLKTYREIRNEGEREKFVGEFKRMKLESRKQCPACKSSIDAKSRSCPKCSFNIERYDELKNNTDKSMFLSAFKKNREADTSKEQYSRLIKCRACGADISVLAWSCPKCGEPNDRCKKRYELQVAATLLGVIVASVYLLVGSVYGSVAFVLSALALIVGYIIRK